jgi:glycosyltransferase involved in cell wall biosynthesis
MLDKLEAIKERFDEVSQLIVDPEIISDMKQYIQLNKEYKDLQPIMEAHKAYKNLLSNIETAKEMLKDDHNITILAEKFNNSYEDYELNNNLEIIRINRSSNKIIRRLNLLKYMIVNIKTILKYDVIHFHDYATFWSYGLGAYPILKLFGKQIFITFHGWEGDVPPKKSVILKRRLIEKLTTANISVGHFISKWYGTKADIVSYGGVDKAENLSNNKEDYILFVGRLAPDTGIFDYIKAWDIVSKNTNLEFLICGDGALREEIEIYIEEHNIPRVVFKGFVSDVQNYIKDAKVIFTAGYLGILEAFSYKKNVIATYDNELKKDYLEMIPNHEKMMWVVDAEIDNIVNVFNEAIEDNIKKEVAYQYSLENSWEKVKKDYYRLWKM